MEYSNHCRLCFRESDDDISINEMVPLLKDTLRIADIINICVQLKVDDNDSLPQGICLYCKHHLMTFYEFRQKCYETDVILRVKAEDAVLNVISVADIHEDMADSDLKTEFVDVSVLEYVSIKEEGGIQNQHQPTKPKKINKKDIKKPPKEKKIHKCDVCFKTFKTGSQLREHYEIHSEQAKYLCVACGQEFKSKRCLLNHSRKHSGLHECTICEKGYSSKSQLEGHMRVHTGERPFKCNLCNSAYKANDSLKVHFRLHTGEKPFKCRYCDKAFVVGHQRRSHELIHGDKTNRPFKCIICSKDFQKKETFVQHKKLHLDERQFKCQYCEKEFVYRKNWKVHLRTHTGEKPYKCPLCSKAFSQRVCMRTHVDKAHPDQAEAMKEQNFTLST